jgi:hypothetical protein
MSPVTTRPATAELASAARPNRFALWGDLLIVFSLFPPKRGRESELYGYLSALGSKASRTASPNKLKANTTRTSDREAIKKKAGSLVT